MTMAAEQGQPTTLASIADEDGTFAIIAFDQRNTLRRMFSAVGIEATDQDMRDVKVEVTRALTPDATGILLDPQLGVGAVMDAGALDPSCGLLIAAEPTDRGDFEGEPRSYRIPEQNAAWVKSMGGDAVKVLVMMNPQREVRAGEPDITLETVALVQSIVDDCRAQGIPSVIENLIFAPRGVESLTPEQRERAIVSSAELLTATKPDLLKLEYPGSPEGCKRLSEVLTVPWAVLSAGVDFDVFEDVIKVSCDDGGASGFIAGRSVWKEAVGLNQTERATFLSETARPRLLKLREAIAGRATPWQNGGR
jgi:tagatose-1,6-bisphosphate aldolase